MCTCFGIGCERCKFGQFAHDLNALKHADDIADLGIYAGPAITIRSVTRLDADRVSVRVAVPAKAWHAAKRKNDLGHLYGVDISNFIYNACGVNAYYPTVDDTARAMDGFKFIELTYNDSAWTPVNNVIHVDFINKRRVA